MSKNRHLLILMWTSTFLLILSCSHSVIESKDQVERSDELSDSRCRDEFKDVLNNIFERPINENPAGLGLKVTANTCQDTLNHYLLGCLHPMHVDTLFEIWGIKPKTISKDSFRFFCFEKQSANQNGKPENEDIHKLIFKFDTLNMTIREVVIFTSKNGKSERIK